MRLVKSVQQVNFQKQLRREIVGAKNAAKIDTKTKKVLHRVLNALRALILKDSVVKNSAGMQEPGKV
jgi:hypothetical protein